MAGVKLVLRYEDHEVHTEVPLRVDLPEMIRRSRLKAGVQVSTEVGFQLFRELEESLEYHRVLHRMSERLVAKVADGSDP
jgi:hypothetical protein